MTDDFDPFPLAVERALEKLLFDSPGRTVTVTAEESDGYPENHPSVIWHEGGAVTIELHMGGAADCKYDGQTPLKN